MPGVKKKSKWWIVPLIIVLLPLLYYGFVMYMMASPGPPWLPRQQAGEMSAATGRFLADYRESLERLRAAAEAGEPLPEKLTTQIKGLALEETTVSDCYGTDGKLTVMLENGSYSGKGYTMAYLTSGKAPLPEGTRTEEGQTFWTLDKWTRMEQLEEHWYVKYDYVVRG